MGGAGLDPAGTSPGGVGVPVTNYDLVGPRYTESTIGTVSSASIDPFTKDFKFDANGTEEPMGDTDQRIYLCMRTISGSRVGFQDFGLTKPLSARADSQNEVYELVRQAMAPVLDDGSAALLSVSTEVDGTRLYALVVWKDLKKALSTPQTTRLMIG